MDSGPGNPTSLSTYCPSAGPQSPPYVPTAEYGPPLNKLIRISCILHQKEPSHAPEDSPTIRDCSSWTGESTPAKLAPSEAPMSAIPSNLAQDLSESLS